jgi:type IV secretory pathway VirB4 component
MNTKIENMLIEELLKGSDKKTEVVLNLLDKYIKSLVGNEMYYEYRSMVICEGMKEIIEGNMDPEQDIYETPDNKALESASACRMLKYFSAPTEYKVYIEGLRDEHRESKDF